MKPHRALRTTALQQDYWGFSNKTAQKYLKESECSTLRALHCLVLFPLPRSQMQQKTAKATALWLLTVTANDHSGSKLIFCRTYLPRDTRLLPQKLDQHRVSLDSGMLAVGQTGLQQHRTSMPSQRLQGRRRRHSSLNYPKRLSELRARRSVWLRQLAEPSKTAEKYWGRCILLLGPHE